MKPFYIILVLVIVSCSKKEQVAVIKQNVPESHKAKEDSVTTVPTPKNAIKDTLVNLTPDETTCIKEFTTSYKFSAFKVKMYTGKLAAPNFEGNPFAIDKGDVEWITEECKKGINFGGKYTVIHMNCGCMCAHLLMVDRSNGVISKAVGIEYAEGEGRFGYTYQKDSNMIIADSGLFTDDSMTYYTCFYKTVPEIYVWKAKRFMKLQ